jgi:hypothetical protein
VKRFGERRARRAAQIASAGDSSRAKAMVVPFARL